MKFINFFLVLWVIFALLDPYPDCESGYGSRNTIESGSNPDTDPDPQDWFLAVLGIQSRSGLPVSVENLFLVFTPSIWLDSGCRILSDVLYGILFRFLLRGGDWVHDAAVPDPRGCPRDSPGGRANRVPQPRLQICLSPGRRTQVRMPRI